MQKVIIAIDGPAASGKSSTARMLAQRLGYVYLDTGAMYRACALEAQRKGLALEDVDAIAAMMDSINLRMDFAQEQNRVFLDDEDVSLLIRSESISKMSSAISALTPVRLKMVDLQRRIAREGGFILDGRDIGSYVFPDARIKFYLTADVDARAQRRLLELQAKGIDASYEDVRADLLQRDKNDRNRTLAPLVQAEDAILIDTTLLTLEGQVDLLYQHVQRILGGI